MLLKARRYALSAELAPLAQNMPFVPYVLMLVPLSTYPEYGSENGKMMEEFVFMFIAAFTFF